MNKTKILSINIILAIYVFSIISMTSAAVILKSFSTNPNQIAPGETGTIDIVLANNGEEDVEDVSVNLDFTNVPFAPYNSGSDANIDQIESDDSERESFEIIALNDAKSGIYKIPVKISYTEDSIAKTASSLVSVIVGSKPIIETSVEDGLLLKSQQNIITLKIVNKGLADAKFLEAELETSTSYTILSASKVYVGDVDSNDFQTIEYKIFFKENSPNNINLPLTIKYQDVQGNKYEDNINADTKVYTNEQAVQLGLIKKSNTMIYVIIVIALILVFILYRIIRNRRRRKLEEI